MIAAVLFPTLAMLAILTMTSMTAFTASVLAPEAAVAIGVEPTDIGIYMALAYAVAMFVGTATGTLVERHGAIRVCQASMWLAASSMVLLVLASPLAALASALLLGAAYGPFNPASAHVMSRLAAPRWQPLIFSVKQTGLPLGGVLAGAALPPLVAAASWQWAALSTAAAALCVSVMVQPLRSRFDRERRPRRLSWRSSLVNPVRLVLATAVLRRYALVAFLYAGCQMSVGAFMVVYLIDGLGMSLLHAGAVFASLQAGAFAGRLLWGAIAERWVASRHALAALGVLNATWLVLTALMTDAWPNGAIVSLAVALGSCSFGWNGVLLSEIARHAPHGLAGEATGGLQFVMFAGVFSFPPCFGALVGVFDGFLVGFVTLAVVVLGGSTLILAPIGARG